MVEVSWTVTATVPMKADNLKDAIEKVEDMDGLPENSEYLDDSFCVDLESTEDANPIEVIDSTDLIEKLTEAISEWNNHDLQSIANKILDREVKYVGDGQFEIDHNVRK